MVGSKFRIGEWVIEPLMSSHPHELMVELTMRCNYDCIHCFRRKLINEELGEMEFKTFKTLLEQARRAKVRKLVFSGWGEPLVYPMILDVLRLSKEYGFEVLLNTNGALLKDYVKHVVDLGIDEVVVSIDAVEPDLYRKLRIGGSISVVTESLLKLKEEIRRRGVWKPTITTQFTINTLNYGDVKNIVKYAQEVGITRIYISNIIPLSQTYEEKLACYANKDCLKSVEELKHLLIRESLRSNVQVLLPNFTLTSERKCPFMTARAAYIRWDGGVSPCIYYAHNWTSVFMGVERRINAVIFGNILEEDLISIWRSKRYSEFRFRTYFFHMPSCLDCPLVNYCDYTLSNESDCWGNQPSCAHCPYSHDIVRCPL